LEGTNLITAPAEPDHSAALSEWTKMVKDTSKFVKDASTAFDSSSNDV
jgi:hypothetical protein